MSYVVRVVGPSGMERYLAADNREVEYTKDAEIFEDPDKASARADEYFAIARKCWPNPPYVGIEDLEADGP